jgi:hypothetical protein
MITTRTPTTIRTFFNHLISLITVQDNPQDPKGFWAVGLKQPFTILK